MAELDERHRALLRAAVEQVVTALAAQPPPAIEPDPRVGETLAAALARVRHAGQIRDRIADLVAELAEQVTGAVLDEAMVTARHVEPRGATWAQLGAQLGRTGQWCGQRLRGREDTERTVPARPVYSRPWINPHDWELVQRDARRLRRTPQPPPRPSSAAPPAAPENLESGRATPDTPSTPPTPAAGADEGGRHPLGGVRRRGHRRGKRGRK